MLALAYCAHQDKIRSAGAAATAHPGRGVSAAAATIQSLAAKRPDANSKSDIRLQRLLRPGLYKPYRGAAKSRQINAGPG